MEFFYFLERSLFPSAFQTWPNRALTPCWRLYNHRRKEPGEVIEVTPSNPFIKQKRCGSARVTELGTGFCLEAGSLKPLFSDFLLIHAVPVLLHSRFRSSNDSHSDIVVLKFNNLGADGRRLISPRKFHRQ